MKEKSLSGLGQILKINIFLVVCFFFNKIFFKKKLTYIASNGINEFLEIVNEKCKNQITGILLPFNLGYEVFFVNLICQKIIKKFSDENIKPAHKTFWFKKTLKEKKELCKLTLKKFLKITNEIPNSIIFNNIQMFLRWS